MRVREAGVRGKGEGVRREGRRGSEGGESEGKAEGQLLSLLQHSHSLTPFVPSSLSFTTIFPLPGVITRHKFPPTRSVLDQITRHNLSTLQLHTGILSTFMTLTTLNNYCTLLCWISRFITTRGMQYSPRPKAEWNIAFQG